MRETRTRTIAVPCNGCTLCCQKDAVRLLPEDDAATYRTEAHPYLPGELMLAHGPGGNCIYLGPDGCSIHDCAPSLCRSADCRELARSMLFERAMALHKAGRLDLRIWDRGRRLLEAGHGT